MYTSYTRFFFLILISSIFGLPAMADPATDATERIKERLTQIDALKTSGEVGEDAKGYLAPRQELGPRQASIVNAENADRRIVYESVAQRTGQTIDEVGEQRAIQIATRARPGVWLQKPGGDWFQKP